MRVYYLRALPPSTHNIQLQNSIHSFTHSLHFASIHTSFQHKPADYLHALTDFRICHNHWSSVSISSRHRLSGVFFKFILSITSRFFCNNTKFGTINSLLRSDCITNFVWGFVSSKYSNQLLFFAFFSCSMCTLLYFYWPWLPEIKSSFIHKYWLFCSEFWFYKGESKFPRFLTEERRCRYSRELCYSSACDNLTMRMPYGWRE